MSIFNSGKKNLFFIWFVILSLATALLFSGRGDSLFVKSLVFVTGALQSFSSHLRSDIREVAQKYLFLTGAREESKSLKEENLKLKAENQLLKELEYENARLSRLAGFSKRESGDLLSARVTAWDFLSQSQMVVIDKGSRHGVKKTMGVLHPDGVVGYVFQAGLFSSQVVTLFNRLSALPVIHQKSRVKGLIEVFPGGGILVLKYFNLQSYNSADFQTGDPVVTERTRQFPSGFPVGTVHSAKPEGETSERTVLIKPSAPFTALERVFVVLKPREKAVVP